MNDIESYLLTMIPAHPKDVVRHAMDKFQITRAAVHRHLNKLIDSGSVLKNGSKNKTLYALPTGNLTRAPAGHEYDYNVGVEGEHEIWKRDIKPLLAGLPMNIVQICQHGFTEIFNNVIDHSDSRSAHVEVQNSDDQVVIEIIDVGIGIFKKVAEACYYSDYREAILKLHQGKFTTDPKNHSGEGIFFTSRIFDTFSILANGLYYKKDNTDLNDWFFENQKNKETVGTIVTMIISKDCGRKLMDVFNAYSNPNTYKFDKTHIRISLGQFEEDQFVSRSQAKRLTHGLTGFEDIILDFTDVAHVGQGFVDEILAVFAQEHPQTRFIIENANDDIIFMIKRGGSTRELSEDRLIFQLSSM